MPHIQAQGGKTLYIGILVSLTGGDAEDATLEMNAGKLAMEEANAKGGIAGYRIEPIVLDDGTVSTGQYDPAQAAANTRKLVANPNVVAILGPQSSGEVKAAEPIMSEADLPAIAMSATNPDITDPRFAHIYRPKGEVVFFRMVTTDEYQGPNMANFYAEKLNVKSVFVLDDTGAFGVGIADAFQKRAAQKGIKILGRDQVNPREADYMTALTKIRGLNPDALYFGGAGEAEVKLAKQSYEILPKAIKGSGDGIASFIKGGGFPAVEGWYMTQASPHLLGDPKAEGFIQRFHKKYGKYPIDYSVTSYDAVLVMLDAMQRVAKSGKPINRHTVREAILTTRANTIQGVIQFDANGDLVHKVVSVFKIVHDPKYPDDDVLHQAKYVGIAPEH
jgi:branched-chain amino acid transport system substrate-binding protein